MAKQALFGSIKKWVEDLAFALQVYLDEHDEIKSRTQLGKLVGIEERTIQNIVAGDKVFSNNTELYAMIFDKLGIPEADPTTIPVFESFDASKHNLRTVKPLAWSDEKLQQWRESNNLPIAGQLDPTDTQEETAVDSDPTNGALNETATIIRQHQTFERQFVQRFLTSLFSWLARNWTGSQARFVTRVGIKRVNWISERKFNGTVGDDSAAYAAIFRHTRLPEADPRKLPDKLKMLPRGGFKREIRAWTDKDYDKWSLQQDKLEQVSADLVSVVNPTTTPTQATESVLLSPPSRSATPVPQVESPNNSFADDLQSMLLELARKHDRSPAADIEVDQPTLRDLLSAIETIDIKIDGMAKSQRNGQSGPEIEKVSLTALMTELTRRLVESKDSTIEERNEIARRINRQIGKLIPYLSAYGQATPEKREQVLASIEEI